MKTFLNKETKTTLKNMLKFFLVMFLVVTIGLIITGKGIMRSLKDSLNFTLFIEALTFVSFFCIFIV